MSRSTTYSTDGMAEFMTERSCLCVLMVPKPCSTRAGAFHCKVSNLITNKHYNAAMNSSISWI